MSFSVPRVHLSPGPLAPRQGSRKPRRPASQSPLAILRPAPTEATWGPEGRAPASRTAPRARSVLPAPPPPFPSPSLLPPALSELRLETSALLHPPPPVKRGERWAQLSAPPRRVAPLARPFGAWEQVGARLALTRSASARGSRGRRGGRAHDRVSGDRGERAPPEGARDRARAGAGVAAGGAGGR